MTKNTRKGRVYFSYMSTSQFTIEGRQGRDLVAEIEAESMEEYLLACPPWHFQPAFYDRPVSPIHGWHCPPTSIINALRLAHRCSQIAPAWVKLTKKVTSNRIRIAFNLQMKKTKV